MEMNRTQQELKSETTVKLFGDKDENINSILKGMRLQGSDKQIMHNVLQILYSKIERLRGQRDYYREYYTSYEHKQQKMMSKIIQLVEQNDLLKQEIQNTMQIVQENMHSHMIQSPAPLQYYRSCQLQTPALYEQPSIHATSFYLPQEENRPQNRIGQFLKRFSINLPQLKEMIQQHVEEERQMMCQLQSDYERQLYMESKKYSNYDQWLKKIKRQCKRVSS